ncbi:arylesterase [Glaciecola siphonariae]|uniref:Arylesterase n=1 Tax=Glaciecola siphonariae TaxID=521012 RepID=A0ABV9LU42_9ALTE
MAKCIFFIALLFPIIAHSDQAANPNTDYKNVSEYKLLVLGDSLSAAYGLTAAQGWVSLLSDKWEQNGQNIDVVNAAISGDTTDGGLARLPRLLDLHQPTHLYIELGGNNGLQGHNPNKIKQNLAQMIELAESEGVSVILQEIQIPTNYGRRYTNLFVQNYHELAKEYDVPLIPFFLQDIALVPGLMQNDGIHPTAEAQPMIVEFLSDRLVGVIKQ